MKFLSITISKKLFFIFLINSVIMVSISGMVIFSFSGLSSQFDFNSDLSAYKTNLDAIRIEQSKLKGHAQSFYLNVSDQTVKEGLQNMSSSISFISESLGKLKNDENQEINDSTLESIHRFSLKNEQKVKIESLKAKYGSAMPPEQHDAKLKSFKTESERSTIYIWLQFRRINLLDWRRRTKTTHEQLKIFKYDFCGFGSN